MSPDGRGQVNPSLKRIEPLLPLGILMTCLLLAGFASVQPLACVNHSVPLVRGTFGSHWCSHAVQSLRGTLVRSFLMMALLSVLLGFRDSLRRPANYIALFAMAGEVAMVLWRG